MEKIIGYRIGLCSTLDVEDGKHLSEPYFKVYVEYEGGSVWFEDEFNTLDEAETYIAERKYE